MLKPIGWRVVFVVVFLVSLVFVLALVSELFRLTWGEGLTFNFQTGIRTAVFFILLSGYLPCYLAAYSIFMHSLPRLRRVTVSVLIFLMACGLFWFLIGDSATGGEGWALLLGVASVVVADAFADFAVSSGTQKAS